MPKLNEAVYSIKKNIVHNSIAIKSDFYGFYQNFGFVTNGAFKFAFSDNLMFFDFK